MVLAISDRGSPPPVVFGQAEDKVTYAISPQQRYDEEVHQALHGESKESKLYEPTEIQTLVSTFEIPDRFTEESIEFKEAIVECNRKDVFRTSLIQGYISEDWQNFAQWFAYAEFVLYLSFVALVMAQFW